MSFRQIPSAPLRATPDPDMPFRMADYRLRVYRINALEVDRIESLGEDLLDFANINDLVAWVETV